MVISRSQAGQAVQGRSVLELGAGNGLCSLAAARLGAILGNIIFGFMLDVACAVPILLVAALLIGTVQPATRFANSVDDFVFFFLRFQAAACWVCCCPTRPKSR